jgi:hypothetical protein
VGLTHTQSRKRNRRQEGALRLTHELLGAQGHSPHGLGGRLANRAARHAQESLAWEGRAMNDDKGKPRLGGPCNE